MPDQAFKRLRLCIQNDRQIEAKVDDDAPIISHIDLSDLQWQTIELFVNLLRDDRLRQQDELSIFGQHLYNVLFSNGIAPTIDQILADANVPVHLSLEFGTEQHEMAGWPWEHIYCPTHENHGFFLTSRTNLLLTRHFMPALGEDPSDPRLEIPGTRLRTLFFATSPEVETLPAVRYEKVLGTIRKLKDRYKTVEVKAVKPLTDSGEPSATFYRFGAEVEDYRPHIIHFLGHGRYVTQNGRCLSQIAFMTEDTEARDMNPINEEQFVEIIARNKDLKLIFLQACRSGGSRSDQAIASLAQRLAEMDIPAVVAMHYRVDEGAADLFVRDFYNTLLDDKTTLETAVQKGRDRIATFLDQTHKPFQAYGLPVLYARQHGLQIICPLQETMAEQPAAVQPGIIGHLGRARSTNAAQPEQPMAGLSGAPGEPDYQTVRILVYDFLKTYFGSEGDFVDLLFYVDVSEAEISSGTLIQRMGMLINLLQGRNRLPELVRLLKEKRKNAPWPSELDKYLALQKSLAQNAPPIGPLSNLPPEDARDTKPNTDKQHITGSWLRPDLPDEALG